MKLKYAISNLLILIFLMTGCMTSQQQNNKNSSTGNQQQGNSGQGQQSDQEQPQNKQQTGQISDMEQTTEKIITDIETITGNIISSETENKQGNDDGQSSGQESEAKTTANQQNSNSIDNSDGEENKKSDSSESSKPEDKNKNDQTQTNNKDKEWEIVKKSVEKLHNSWNNIEVEIIKNDIDKTLINNFETTLNDLTMKVISKNDKDSLISANQLYQYIILISKNMKSEDTNIKLMKYYTREIIYESENNKWDTCPSYIKSLHETYNDAQSKSEIKDNNTNIKIKLAIDDLNSAVNSRNKDITKIKGKVLFKDINDINKGKK